MTYEESTKCRAELLADAPVQIHLRDDDPDDHTVGTVVEMTEDLHRLIVNQSGDDVEVMVWVRWSRTHVRPEYVENLVRA